MKKQILFAGAFAGAALACALPASAQSIDYGSLTQLFGEPVTTSATGSPQRSTEAPVDMTIVSAEDIKRSGATDIPTILSRVAGVDVINWTAGASDVAVRGYDQAYSPRLLVLINGRQVYLDHYGYTAWSTLPVQLDEIRQIEVVRGPNSALFGFNAVGGVVNIITYNPKYDQVTTGTVRAGSQGYVSGDAVATFKLGERVHTRLSAGIERQDEWNNAVIPSNVISTHDPKRWSANLDSIVELAPKTELRLEGSYSDAQQSDVAPTYTVYALHYKLWSAKGTLTSDTKYGLLQGQAYINHAKTTFDYTGVHYDFDNPIVVASVQDLFKVGAAHTFRLGVEFRHNKMNTTPAPGGEVSYTVWAPSAMWNWNVSRRFALTAAARLDHLQLKRTGTFPDPNFPNADNANWDRQQNVPSYNAGAVFKLTDLDTFRAAYARGVQAPTLLEYGGVQSISDFGPPFGEFAITGTPFLRPAIVSNYELSYDRALPQLGAKFGIKGFYQRTKDVKTSNGFFVLNTPPALSELTYANVGVSEMKGFELSASGKVKGGFRWSADYTYTKVETQFPAELLAQTYTPESLSIAFDKTTPKWRGNASLGWSDEHWAVDGYLHYTGKFGMYGGFGLPLTPVDAYATLAARVGYTFDNGVELAVSGQNLGKSHQAQGNALYAPRRVLVSLSKSW